MTKFSLIRCTLPERQAVTAVTFAASFNLLGLPIQLIILRHLPDSYLPAFISMSFGGAIALLLNLGRLKNRTAWAQWLFILNASFVSYALFSANSFFGGPLADSVPFQATKLGTLIAAILAPGFLAGLAAVVIHSGTSILQYLAFSPQLKSQIISAEPWALIGFALGGFFILLFRFRIYQIQEWALKLRTEAESTKQVAQKMLEIRDLMNTPLQTIELAVAYLRKNTDKKNEDSLNQLSKSCERLRNLNDTLRQYETHIDWQSNRGGLES